MAEAEVGDDVYGEDPTVRALAGAGRRRCSGSRRRCSRRPARWPTCSRSRRWSATGRRCSASRARTSLRAELGAHGALHRAHHAHLGRRAGQIDLDAIRGDVRAGHGPVLRAHHARSRSRTPTTSAAGRCSRSTTCRRCASSPTSVGVRACTSTARGSGTRTSRPALRSSAYGAIADTMAVCLSKGLGAPGRLARWSARRTQVDEARVLAQAAGRRHAPGRRPRRGRALRARPPHRAAGRGPRARPAARRGVRRRPDA